MSGKGERPKRKCDRSCFNCEHIIFEEKTCYENLCKIADKATYHYFVWKLEEEYLE